MELSITTLRVVDVRTDLVKPRPKGKPNRNEKDGEVEEPWNGWRVRLGHWEGTYTKWREGEGDNGRRCLYALATRDKSGAQGNNDTTHMQAQPSCDRVMHYCLVVHLPFQPFVLTYDECPPVAMQVQRICGSLCWHAKKHTRRVFDNSGEFVHHRLNNTVGLCSRSLCAVTDLHCPWLIMQP